MNYVENTNSNMKILTAPGCRDDLPAAAVDGLAGDDGVQDLELGVPDRLLAEGALARAPLEALHDGVLDGAEEALVHLGGEGVVDEDVGA
jgi:hypothetical protein